MKLNKIDEVWNSAHSVTFSVYCYPEILLPWRNDFSLFSRDLQIVASVRLSDRTDVAKTSPAKTRRAWSGDVGGGGKGRIASSLPSPRVSVFLSFFGTLKRLRRPLHNYHMKANGRKTLMFSLYLSRFVLFSVWLTVFIFTRIKMP